FRLTLLDGRGGRLCRLFRRRLAVRRRLGSCRLNCCFLFRGRPPVLRLVDAEYLAAPRRVCDGRGRFGRRRGRCDGWRGLWGRGGGRGGGLYARSRTGEKPRRGVSLFEERRARLARSGFLAGAASVASIVSLSSVRSGGSATLSSLVADELRSLRVLTFRTVS